MDAYTVKAGEKIPVGEKIYSVLDATDTSVQVLAEPRPSWAGPAWIAREHLTAIIENR